MIGQQQEPAGDMNDLFSTQALKSKREKFTVDIRKQKNQEMFNKKRFRFVEPNDEGTDKEMLLMMEGGSKTQGLIYSLSDKPLDQILEQLSLRIQSHVFEGLDELSSLIIRKFTDNNQENIDLIMKMQIAPLLIKACHTIDTNISLQFVKNTLMILINVLSGKSEYVIECLQAGVLSLFTNFLREKGSSLIIEDTFWGLANIAAENNESVKEELLKCGILDDIAKLDFNTFQYGTLTELTRFLSNLSSDCCPDCPQINQVICLTDAVMKLPNALDAQLLNNCMQTLFNLSKLDAIDIDQIILSNLFTTVYELLMQNEKYTYDILKFASQFMYNLFSTYYYEFDVDFEADSLGLVDLALLMMTNTEKYLMISGLEYLEIYAEAGEAKGVTYIMTNKNVLKELFNLSLNPNFEIRKKALMTFSQMLGNAGEAEELEALLESPDSDLLEVYCKSLSMNMNDQDFIVSTLNAFKAILEHGETVKDDKSLAENPFVIKIQNYHCHHLLVELQDNPTEDIYKLTKEILEEYF